MVHTHALVLGFVDDPFSGTALVMAYLSYGAFGDARYLFDGLSCRDVVSWTGLISGLVDQRCYGQVLDVFSFMKADDVGDDIGPNVATVVSAMSACAGLGSLDHVKRLHAYLEKAGLEGDVFVRNPLIDAYAKCGNLPSAKRVFDGMGGKDLHSWTAMISSLASHVFGKEALHMFSRMQWVGIEPDSITFLALLSVSSHAGLVEEGIKIFDTMEKVYEINPEDKHCGMWMHGGPFQQGRLSNSCV